MFSIKSGQIKYLQSVPKAEGSARGTPIVLPSKININNIWIGIKLDKDETITILN